MPHSKKPQTVDESAEPTPSSQRYLMTGTQGLRLPDQIVSPGAGEFSANLTPEHEEFLIRVGAIRKVGR